MVVLGQPVVPLVAPGTSLRAVSISRSVSELVTRAPTLGTVLGAFDRAMGVLLPDGSLVALVLPEVGDGPFNVVIAGKPGVFAHLEPGLPARLGNGRLQVGGLQVSLSGATIWEPRPDWESLRAGYHGARRRLALVRTFGLRTASRSSLLTLLHGGELRDADHSILHSAVRAAAEALRAGWNGHTGSLGAAATELAGLGSGLTPAGDDFLVGVMVRAWLSHPMPADYCRTLAEQSIPHTTTLSASFLRAAADGECTAAWHDLLITLESGSELEMENAVSNVVRHGHTSGADALAGFLWVGA